MSSALLLSFSMLFLFLVRHWLPVGAQYVGIFELSFISSLSFRYIYISSLALFPSSAYFQAPCLFLLRSWHTLNKSWQCDIQYLCLLATSRADVLNLQAKSSHPHKNQQPSHRSSACLFCSGSHHSNKGSALSLVPVMGSHRWQGMSPMLLYFHSRSWQSISKRGASNHQHEQAGWLHLLWAQTPIWVQKSPQNKPSVMASQRENILQWNNFNPSFCS